MESSLDDLNDLKKHKYLKLSENIDYIKGYYPYVKDLKENVFKFKQQDINAATKIYETMQPQNHTMVSIHIRMTDYKEHVQKLYNINSIPAGDYLTRAMDYFVDLTKGYLA